KDIRAHHLSENRPLPSVVSSAVEHGLARAFGQGQWIQDFDGFYLNLNRATLKQHQVETEKAATLAAEEAASVPGVLAAFTRSQFLSGMLPSNPLGRKAINSYHVGRSGDVFIELEPFALPIAGEVETSHGSPWGYDAQ